MQKVLLGLFFFGSLALMGSGYYFGGMWACFGLVLFMTSLLMWVCHVFGATLIERVDAKVGRAPPRAA